MRQGYHRYPFMKMGGLIKALLAFALGAFAFVSTAQARYIAPMSQGVSASQPTVGVGVVIVKGSEVLMIRRGQPPRQGEWSIPGGTQELGETVRETAVREILEETGLSIANLKLIDVVDAFGKHPDGSLRTQWVLVDFRADWVAGEPVAGSDAAHAEWMSLERITALELWPETLRIIETALKMG